MDTKQKVSGDQGLWNKDFLFVILINFLIFVNHVMTLSTFPFYIESLGGSEALAGLTATLFALVAVLFRPFIGLALNRGKRRILLLAGIAGMAMIPMGYLAVPVLSVVFVFRMAHGAALSFSNTTSSTIATDIVPKKRFAEGMGMFGVSTAFACACAPALGLALMNGLGYSALFAAETGCMAVAFLLFLFLKVPEIPARKVPFRVKELIDRDALPASVIMFVFLLTFGALENFIALFASKNHLPSGGIFFTIMAVMLFVTRATVGKVADRKGEGVFVYSCNASMFAAFLLLAFLPGTITFLIAAVLAGYGFGGLEPALQSMAVHIAPPERRGSANSTFLCAYDIGWGLGGGIAGYLISGFGYSTMFTILSLANIVSVLLYVVWGRKHPSSFSFAIREQSRCQSA